MSNKKYQLQTIQVKPLPLSGSGGKTSVGQQLAKHNQLLTMQLAQSISDTKYDPQPPARPSKQVFVEHFTGGQYGIICSLSVAGILMIVYGIVVE